MGDDPAAVVAVVHSIASRLRRRQQAARLSHSRLETNIALVEANAPGVPLWSDRLDEWKRNVQRGMEQERACELVLTSALQLGEEMERSHGTQTEVTGRICLWRRFAMLAQRSRALYRRLEAVQPVVKEGMSRRNLLLGEGKTRQLSVDRSLRMGTNALETVGRAQTEIDMGVAEEGGWQYELVKGRDHWQAQVDRALGEIEAGKAQEELNRFELGVMKRVDALLTTLADIGEALERAEETLRLQPTEAVVLRGAEEVVLSRLLSDPGLAEVVGLESRSHLRTELKSMQRKAAEDSRSAGTTLTAAPLVPLQELVPGREPSALLDEFMQSLAQNSLLDKLKSAGAEDSRAHSECLSMFCDFVEGVWKGLVDIEERYGQLSMQLYRVLNERGESSEVRRLCDVSLGARVECREARWAIGVLFGAFCAGVNPPLTETQRGVIDGCFSQLQETPLLRGPTFVTEAARAPLNVMK